MQGCEQWGKERERGVREKGGLGVQHYFRVFIDGLLDMEGLLNGGWVSIRWNLIQKGVIPVWVSSPTAPPFLICVIFGSICS